MELNSEQAVAVAEPSDDFVLSAGAGSGKTRVLTERYALAVEAAGKRAFDTTLAITFTEKAAGELWHRVRERISEDCGGELADHMDRAWISTIHSMCARLLRRHALEAGLDPQFCVGSAVELGVIRKRVFDNVVSAVLDSADSDDQVPLLLRAFRLSELFALVTSISAKVRALGLWPDQVITCDPADSSSIRAMLDALDGLAREYEAQPETPTVLDNAAKLREFVSLGRCWTEGTAPPLEFAVAAQGLKQHKRGRQAVKDIAEQAEALAEHLGLHAAQEVAQAHEKALIELTVRFSDSYALARRNAHVLDFEDLQGYVIELFDSHPDIAARYAAQFSSVMVDEFQDTDALQVRLIEHLAPGGFVAVGDEKQSIYRFRHADVDIFKRRAEAALVRRTLRTNYRSHPALVEFFNEAFGQEPFWPDGFLRLEPGRGVGPGPGNDPYCDLSRVTAILIDAAMCGQDKDADEAAVLAAHVRGLIDKGVPPCDIVVLLRAMTRADTFAGALRDVGIEVFVASGGTYFNRPEVVDLEMLLRVVSNTKDSEALLHVLAGPLTVLSDNALGVIRVKTKNGSIWSWCRDVENLGLSPDDAEKLDRVVGVVEWFRTGVSRAGLAGMIREACERLEYDLTLFARGFEGVRAWSNVLKLARIAGDFDLTSPGDAQAFLDYLALKRELEGGESLAAFAVEGIDAVRIMSIHAAKGLEFPVTIVANLGRHSPRNNSVILSTVGGEARLGMRLPPCEEGIASSMETFGYRQVARVEREADLAEERRLFYVACTRAQEGLVLCGRTRFDKEAESPGAIGWLRETLGFAEPDSVIEGEVSVGKSLVRVVAPEPLTCGPVGLVRPQVDERTLEVARAAPVAEAVFVPAGPERISYSGLARYRSCPYRYHVSSVARLGSRSPHATGGDTAVALGNAVHALLKVVEGSNLPEPLRTEEICRSASLPRELWPCVSELAKAFLGSDTWQRVVGCDRVSKELPFAVPIGDTLLDGAIDLIAWDGDSALVVDYKTGSAESGGAQEAYRAQAECYAIAAFALGATCVEVRFVGLRKACQTVVFEYESADADELRSNVSREISLLRQGHYEPLKRFDPFVCPECPALGGLCPVSAPGRKPAA